MFFVRIVAAFFGYKGREIVKKLKKNKYSVRVLRPYFWLQPIKSGVLRN